MCILVKLKHSNAIIFQTCITEGGKAWTIIIIFLDRLKQVCFEIYLFIFICLEQLLNQFINGQPIHSDDSISIGSYFESLLR